MGAKWRGAITAIIMFPQDFLLYRTVTSSLPQVTLMTILRHRPNYLHLTYGKLRLREVESLAKVRLPIVTTPGWGEQRAYLGVFGWLTPVCEL